MTLLKTDNKTRMAGLIEEQVLKRGFLFACTKDTEEECFNRMLFATEKTYGPIVIRIRQGDLLFLNNIDTDVIYGVFR